MRYFLMLLCTVLVISSSGCAGGLKAVARSAAKNVAKPGAAKAIAHAAPGAAKPGAAKAIAHGAPKAAKAVPAVHENKWDDATKKAAEVAGKGYDAYQEAARRSAKKDQQKDEAQ